MKPSNKSKAFVECCKISDLATPALYSKKYYKFSKNSSLMNDNSFENYLLDIALPDLKSKEAGFKLADMYPVGGSKVVDSLVKDIKIVVPTNTLKFIGNLINSDSTTVHCWRTGYNSVPLLKLKQIFDVWKKTCKISKQEFTEKWNKVFQNTNSFHSGKNSAKVKLPKYLSTDLAYVVGFLLADGYIKSQTKLLSRGKHPEYSVVFYDNSKAFLEKFDKILANLFDVKCNQHLLVSQNGSCYALRCTSKPIHRFFTEVLKIPEGYKQGNIVVPKIIEDSPREIQKAFIAGFCDGEGCVGISTKNPYFEVVQASYTGKSPQILDWISAKLNEFGVRVSVPQRGTGFWRIRSASQKVINKYYTIISSRHVDKIPKFEEVRRFSYAEHRKSREGGNRA